MHLVFGLRSSVSGLWSLVFGVSRVQPSSHLPTTTVNNYSHLPSTTVVFASSRPSSTNDDRRCPSSTLRRPINRRPSSTNNDRRPSRPSSTNDDRRCPSSTLRRPINWCPSSTNDDRQPRLQVRILPSRTTESPYSSLQDYGDPRRPKQVSTNPDKTTTISTIIADSPSLSPIVPCVFDNLRQ